MRFLLYNKVLVHALVYAHHAINWVDSIKKKAKFIDIYDAVSVCFSFSFFISHSEVTLSMEIKINQIAFIKQVIKSQET